MIDRLYPGCREAANPYLASAATLFAGLDGITFSMPDVHDTEMVTLAGETLGAVIGARAA